MKTFKVVMYDIGIMAATVISMWLMLSLVVNTVLSCSTSFLKKENVEEMIESIDYTEFVLAEIEKTKDGNIQAIDDEVIEEIMKTEMVDEILELCMENIFAQLEGEKSEDELSVKEIKRIGNKYSDEIEDLLKEHYGKSSSMTDDQIENVVDNLIETYSKTIVEMAPTVETLGLTQEDIEVVSSVKNGTYFWISCGVTAVLTLLIFLILISKFKGLLWLSIDYLLVATGTLIASFFINDLVDTLAKGTLLNMIDITSATDSISGSMLISAIVMYVIAIVFMILFIVTKVSKKKGKKEKIVVEVFQPIESAQPVQQAEVTNEGV